MKNSVSLIKFQLTKTTTNNWHGGQTVWRLLHRLTFARSTG